jgi:hypothetical protein
VVNGTANQVCLIATTTCDSGGTTVSVPAGSTLTIEVQPISGSGTIAGFDLLFGWHMTN